MIAMMLIITFGVMLRWPHWRYRLPSIPSFASIFQQHRLQSSSLKTDCCHY